MSGHPDCPMCRQRVVYQADGVTVALRDPACTHRAGCVERNKLVAGLLHDAGPVLEQMHGEAQQAADRARIARIQAAREAVLEAARAEYAAGQRYHRDQTLEANDAHTDALVRYQRCVVDMIEAEGETP